MNGPNFKGERSIALCALLFLLWPLVAVSATTWHVDGGVVASGDGLSWETAKKTIQEAVDAALDGDEIWIAEGVYSEQVSVGAGLFLYGGFSRGETSAGERDLSIHRTVLDGTDETADEMIGVRGDLAFVIDGIDIRYAPAVGIGASLWGDGSGCSIRNCRFTGNRGTAVTLSALSFTMNNCVFENNADVALNLDEGSFTIDQCVFTGNKGGFRAIAGGVISNCLIAGNCGESFGGIRFEGSVSIINCTISGNFATSGNFDATGGIKCATHWMWIWRPFSPPGPLSPAPFLLPPGEWMPWPSHGNVVNCILSGNGPNGIYFDSLSSLTAQNCLFFENGYAAQSDYYNLPHNSHSDHHDYLDAASLNSSLPGAAGNLDGDPAFANAAAGDFHLTAGSAAIDRGTSVPLAWDLNGAPRPVDIPGVGVDGPLAYDIGACEYQFLTPIGPPSLSSALDAGDGAVGLAWTDDNATTPSQFLSFAYDVYAGEFAPRGWAGTIWYPFAPPARSGPMNVAETGAYFAWISDQWWDGTWLACLNPAALIVYSGTPHAPIGLWVEKIAGSSSAGSSSAGCPAGNGSASGTGWAAGATSTGATLAGVTRVDVSETSETWRLHWNPEIYGTWLDQIAVYENDVGWVAPLDGPSSAYPQFSPWTFLDYGGLAYDASKASFLQGWADLTLPAGGSYLFFLNFKAWDAATAGPFALTATP